MSYRPRSRSRSPEYRARRDSPSRPLSPPPAPRRFDDRPPQTYRQDRWSPPPLSKSRDGFSPVPRARDEYAYPPPPRRYDDSPPRRYDDPPRRYDDRAAPMRPPPPARYEEERYPPPARDHEERLPRREYDEPRGYDDRDRDRDREWDRRYDGRPPMPSHGGMAADREEARKRGDVARAEPQWERGRSVEELDSYSNTHSPAPGPGPSDYGTVPPSKRHKGRNDPSKDVIFLGLDPELTETDFAGYLRAEHGAEIESVKIVRDKMSGHSKGFGFALFNSLDAASVFINENYPAVLMPALYAHSDPRKVKIDFSATQSGQSNFDNTASGSGHNNRPYIAAPGHDGMRDIGGPSPDSRVLLLRGLDPHTPARAVVKRISQEIARMVGKIGKELTAESTIVRFTSIVDRSARSSWGYGFLELATPELAAALLPFLLTPQYQPNGFVIDYMPIAASFANLASFVPTPAGPLGGEFLLRASRSGGIGSETIDKPDGHWVGYWHPHAGCAETLPDGAPAISDNGTFELNAAQRAFLGPLAGIPSTSENVAQSSGPGSGVTAVSQVQAGAPLVMGGLQPIKLGGVVKGKKKEEPAIIPIMTKNMLDDGEEVDLVGKDTVLLSRTKGVHIIPPTSSSRKIAKNISKWNNKQTELAAPEAVDTHAPPKGISDVNTTLGVRRPLTTANASQGPASTPSAPGSGPEEADQSTSNAAGPSSPSGGNFDYTDVTLLASTGKVACLLCQRQFKTEEVLRKHVVQSDLHKTNLLDAAVCEAGRRRKHAITANNASASSGSGTIAAAAGGTDTEPKYRDRAAERRTAFNQPNAPIPEGAPVQNPPKRKYAEGPKAPPPPTIPEPVVHPGADEGNKGNQLLAKMGWKAGSGLGLGGEGRVDPVLVQQFENRAGLGASKGVEAGRWGGPGGFQQRALDMAKQRYHSSSDANQQGQGSK